MRKSEFMRLPEFEDEADTGRLKIGDKFLYGKSIIGQKLNKTQNGQSITYYIVIGKNQYGIEYAPIYDYMETDKGEE